MPVKVKSKGEVKEIPIDKVVDKPKSRSKRGASVEVSTNEPEPPVASKITKRRNAIDGKMPTTNEEEKGKFN